MKKVLLKKIFLISCLLLSTYSILWAQDDKSKSGDVGNEQITVIKAYLPTLSDAIKISDVPYRDSSTFYAPDLKYTIDSKKLDTKYNITPIKPVKIKDENIKKLYRGFVKAGYGNYNTPYGEIFYNAMRSKEFDAGVHLKHLSSSGRINGYGFPGYSENNIELFGKKYMDNTVLDAKLAYERNVVHYYGYAEPPELFSKEETMHRMGNFSGDFSLYSSHNAKDKLDYKAGLGFYSFSDNLGQSETDFDIHGMAGKHLGNGHYVKANISLDVSKATMPGNYCPPWDDCNKPLVAVPDLSINSSIFKFEPRYEFTQGGVNLSAGANIVIESAYDKTKYHFYPFVYANYPLIKDEVSLFGELNGDLKKNTFQSLNHENPFIIPTPFSGQNYLINTNNKFDIKGGIIVKPDRELQIKAWAGFSRLLNDLFFVNSLNTTGITTYSPVYYDNSQLNIHAEAQYLHGDKLTIFLKNDYFSYSLPDSLSPWFKPSLLFTLGGNYNIGDKIFVKTELFYAGSRTAATIDGKGTDLKPFVDLNLGVEYHYSKLIGVFVNVNNLTASRYFKWYNYPSYKINVMGGVTYSF